MKVFYSGKGIHGSSIELVNKLADADVYIVEGGDGTMLRAVSHICLNKLWHIAILGSNTGHVGFLSNDLNIKLLNSVLNKSNIDDLPIEERNLLIVENNGQYHYALNEVVLQPQAPGHLFEVGVSLHNLEINGKMFILEYKGDGVIISTASGSTAYNLSAGGPIVLPELNTLTITPICPFSLATRPLIIPGRTTICIDTGAPAYLTVDGVATEAHNLIHVRMSQHKVRLVKFSSFVDAVHEKLGWNRSIK